MSRCPSALNCWAAFNCWAILLLFALGCGGVSKQAGSTPPATAEAPSALAAAVAADHRSAEHRSRDRYRHPKETLEFFGVEPGMRVVEIRPGRGWYTEILAPYLQGQGELVAAIPSPTGAKAAYHQRFVDLKMSKPGVFGQVQIGTFEPPSEFDFGPAESADRVLTFRNLHNMIGANAESAAFEAFFAALKPGGVLGIVQHRAAAGADPSEEAAKGYVPEAYVVELATAAGFVLDGRSEINANPADTRDHPEGVWTLPPVLRSGDQNRDRYLAIGESDRMTLRFRKPMESE
ncbi:MAG: methyltransferase [Myxococcota bacterium]